MKFENYEENNEIGKYKKKRRSNVSKSSKKSKHKHKYKECIFLTYIEDFKPYYMNVNSDDVKLKIGSYCECGKIGSCYYPTVRTKRNEKVLYRLLRNREIVDKYPDLDILDSGTLEKYILCCDKSIIIKEKI